MTERPRKRRHRGRRMSPDWGPVFLAILAISLATLIITVGRLP